MLDEHTARIRVLNDRLRQGLIGGRIHVTSGVAALGADAAAEAWRAVTEFTDFKPSNDPYGEHDFGAFQLGDRQLFWQIAYYDTTLSGGAPDPADETTCVRVLTIMLAEEY